MRIQVEKFLALTALLASTAALGAGCTTEDTTANTDAGVSGSGGTSTGGTAGSATGGQAGTAATGGTAGAAGGGGTAGAAGGGGTAGAAGGDGGTCLGDAGNEIDCTQLSYWATSCPDAGTESLAPLGSDLCIYMAADGRPGVADKVYTCLAAITGDACAAAHDTAVQKCIDDNFPLACQKPPLTDPEGGSYDPCADVASSCPATDAGEAGITKAECDYVLNVLSDTAEATVLNCYDTPVTNSCSDDFYNCVGLP